MYWMILWHVWGPNFSGNSFNEDITVFKLALFVNAKKLCIQNVQMISPTNYGIVFTKAIKESKLIYLPIILILYSSFLLHDIYVPLQFP